MKRLIPFGVVACGLLLSLAGCMPGAPARTLQHDGGARLTLRATCPADKPNCDLNSRMQSAMDVLARRASAAGYSNVVVRKGDDAQTVVVEAPSVSDGQKLVPLMTSNGQIFFIDTGDKSLSVGDDVSGSLCESGCTPGQFAILFRSEDLDTNSVSAELDSNTQQPVVTYQFKGDAQKRFANYTGSHVGQYLTITLDGKVIEAAVIQSQITGPGQISGNLTEIEAKTLAAELKSGALPLVMTLVNVEQVTPSATK